MFKQLCPLWIAVTLIILCFNRSWKIIGWKNQSETSSAATIRRLWKCLSAEKKKPWKGHRPGAHYIFTDRLDRKTTTRGVKAWRTCYRTLSWFRLTEQQKCSHRVERGALWVQQKYTTCDMCAELGRICVRVLYFCKPGSKRGLKTEVIWTEMEYDAIILSEKVKLANCLASKCSGSQLMLFIYWKRWFFLKKNKIAHQSMHSSIFL